jgi:ABC-type transport system involved in cytochrome c biogenesis permease component
VRAALALFAKDLRILRRSPLVALVLVGYPLVVSLLVAAALQSGERTPALAVVNLDAPGRTVQVGERRLSVDDYLARLDEEVDLRRLDADEAGRALDDGRVAAVLTIPEGFISDLQSGVRQPLLRLVTSARSPLEGEAISRRLQAAVFRFNQGLATGYVRQVLRLVDFISNGGSIGIFGRQGEVVGLRNSRVLIAETQDELRRSGRADLAARLDPLLVFIDETQANLDLARPAATAIASPIRLEVAEGAEGREPLSAFGVAGALLVSLALVGGLLGAAGIASEREEDTLTRLRRGLVALPLLVVEKIVVAALACTVIGGVLLAAVAVLTDLAVGRWALWPPALALAGLAFAAVGVLIGAAARDTRTALLATLMISLPLIFVGLVPDDAAAAVASLVPFGPAFRIFRDLLAEPRLDAALAGDMVALALMAALATTAAAVLLRRRGA